MSSRLLQIFERIDQAEPSEASLTLDFEQRQKSRLRVQLDNGEWVGLFLKNGTTLKQGDLLRAENGMVVLVNAAPEKVTTMYTDDIRQLAVACYHLGNRHTPVQIGDGWVRYLSDHVLDEMIQALGLETVAEITAFEPVGGAYHAEAVHSH